MSQLTKYFSSLKCKIYKPKDLQKRKKKKKNPTKEKWCKCHIWSIYYFPCLQMANFGTHLSTIYLSINCKYETAGSAGD